MKKILVIEDDMFLNKIYKLKLSKSGYEVVSLLNGIGALEMVKTIKPDLVLLDILMSGKDGFQVLKELRADAETVHYPVVVLSNLGQVDDIKAGLALGANEYYVKSDVAFSKVLHIVKQYVV